MTTTITRRALAKNLGLATGAAALGFGVARAAVVTPWQTDGPFYPEQRAADVDMDLTLIDGHDEVATGEQILVSGRVLDLEGNPQPGATVDVWQANHHGRYAHSRDPNDAPLDPHFQGHGIIKTDAQGRYAFRTIKPGAYPLEKLGGSGWRCRHIHFKVGGPGLRPLTTQMYFEGDPLIAQDGEIAKVEKPLQHLLIASAVTDEASGLLRYEFDVVLASG